MQAREVAGAVVVGVEEAPDQHLVEDGPLEPVGDPPRPGARRTARRVGAPARHRGRRRDVATAATGAEARPRTLARLIGPTNRPCPARARGRRRRPRRRPRSRTRDDEGRRLEGRGPRRGHGSSPSSIARLARPWATTGPGGQLGASARASSSTSVAGTTRSARPMASASSAPHLAAGEDQVLGPGGPTRRGSRWVPPPPGTIPRRISGWPSRASSATTRRSQARASSQPAAQGVAVDGGDRPPGQGGQGGPVAAWKASATSAGPLRARRTRSPRRRRRRARARPTAPRRRGGRRPGRRRPTGAAASTPSDRALALGPVEPDQGHAVVPLDGHPGCGRSSGVGFRVGGHTGTLSEPPTVADQEPSGCRARAVGGTPTYAPSPDGDPSSKAAIDPRSSSAAS